MLNLLLAKLVLFSLMYFFLQSPSGIFFERRLVARFTQTQLPHGGPATMHPRGTRRRQTWMNLHNPVLSKGMLKHDHDQSIKTYNAKFLHDIVPYALRKESK